MENYGDIFVSVANNRFNIYFMESNSRYNKWNNEFDISFITVS